MNETYLEIAGVLIIFIVALIIEHRICTTNRLLKKILSELEHPKIVSEVDWSHPPSTGKTSVLRKDKLFPCPDRRCSGMIDSEGLCSKCGRTFEGPNKKEEK